MASIVDYFVQNPAHLFFTIAGLCLVMELGVLGMSGPLLFVSIGSLLTGVMISLGIISGWQMAILALGLLTALSALLLWKPFKRFQNEAVAPDTSSDMIGRILPVAQMVTRDQGSVSYSGIEWQARLDKITEPVAAGSRVRVVAVDGSLLLVIPE
ncbi:MAG TPA: acriflavin resistance protein [Cellvibrio sp.]|uniref:NfeD family protein n=1 Tax=Cellvibrio sp. TaxID=1965322 RepID=UPI000EC264F2|nr:NfeD family protein [Cellvibrio sp.]HCS64398.1 acriflavin resistance protein [Cellvibrio sp.]